HLPRGADADHPFVGRRVPRAHAGHMNLLDADLRRFAARRMMRGALVLSAAIVVVSIVASATHNRHLHVGTQLEDAIEGTGVAMLFVAFVLGASFAGAEFNGSSLSTQLLFVPRRGRVHTSKAAAAAIGTGVVAVLVLVLL